MTDTNLPGLLRAHGDLRRGPPLSPLALALTTLALIAASLTLCWYQLSLPEDARGDFLLRNVLGIELRRQLITKLVVSAAVPPVLALGTWLIWQRRAERWITRTATIAAPLVIAAAIPSLFNSKIARDHTLGYLGWLLLVSLLFRTLLTRSIQCVVEVVTAREGWMSAAAWWKRTRPPHWFWLVLVGLASAGYTAFVGYYTIVNHHQIRTTAFDLGIYDNLMYNALKFHPFHSPVLFGPGNQSYIAGHAEYAMVLFVPLYAIRPGSETLLLIQAGLLGFAAVPLYLFGAHFIPKAQAAVLALAYLLFAPLHGPNFYDFHWLPLAIFFHFLLYWAITVRKTWLVVVTVLILFAIREDVAVGLATLGAFLFLTGARQRLGLVLAATSAIWFGINKFMIMPWAGTWWFENLYKDLFADGVPSYGSVIKTMITNPTFTASTVLRPEKLEYVLHLTVPLALVPLRRWYFLLPLFPAAMFTIFTTAYAPTISIAFQYTTHAIPYLFLTSVLGLWLMRSEARGNVRSAATVAAVLLATLSHSRAFGAILQQENFYGGGSRIDFTWTREMANRYDLLKSVTALIPRSASVAATECMVPHISARREAFVLRGDPGPVDYIFVSALEMRDSPVSIVRERMKNTPYGLVTSAGEFYLFKRDHYSADTEAALRRFGLGEALRVPQPGSGPHASVPGKSVPEAAPPSSTPTAAPSGSGTTAAALSAAASTAPPLTSVPAISTRRTPRPATSAPGGLP